MAIFAANVRWCFVNQLVGQESVSGLSKAIGVDQKQGSWIRRHVVFYSNFFACEVGTGFVEMREG